MDIGCFNGIIWSITSTLLSFTHKNGPAYKNVGGSKNVNSVTLVINDNKIINEQLLHRISLPPKFCVLHEKKLNTCVARQNKHIKLKKVFDTFCHLLVRRLSDSYAFQGWLSKGVAT